MKKLAVLIAVIVFFVCGCLNNKKEQVSQSSFMLDTFVNITVDEYDGTEKNMEYLINDCFTLCHEYETMFSRTIEDSEVSQINNSNGNEITISDNTAQLIKMALEFSESSDGKFDITTAPLSDLWDFKNRTEPPNPNDITKTLSHINYKNIIQNGNTIKILDPLCNIDLGGIAKGFIADKIKEFLIDNGVKKAVIDFGGNIVLICPSDELMSIGIQKPFEKTGKIFGIITTSQNSIVTSGSYQRYFEYSGEIYHHILDTKTGYPVKNDIYSVTVCGPSSAVCDALSTTIFCLGIQNGLELINNIEGYEAVIIDKNYKTIFSNNMSNMYKHITN